MIKYLGEYKICERLGGGGNATVYRGENRQGENVAVKIFREENVTGKKARKRNNKKKARFIIETNTVIGIQDEIKGVIPILNWGLPDKKTKKFWYAMPIAIPVQEKFKDLKTVEERVEAVLELAKTLCLLHKKGIVHRDIKPQNIYYYNEKYCLGDFGVVDFPDRQELTSFQEAVGPKATMAPEMRYNAKNADGKAADVYSLAKTLWILLKEVEYGFEGRYEEDDTIIGLRSDTRYKTEYLVELEILLKRSTEYDSALRPNMDEFVEILEKWLETKKNLQMSNHSEWRYLQNKLFPQTIPLRTEWRDIDSIIKVLNMIGRMPNLNHMFLPTGGGQDIEYAEYAAEKDCICLVAGGANYIIKPARLELENCSKYDYRWSYFRLELQNLKPVSSALYKECRECLIEDYPGNYVISKLARYERYEDGTEFPKDYKIVDRFIKGSFVIFSKQSIYNHVPGTYDARHNTMNSNEFHKYIMQMRNDYNSANRFSEFLNGLRTQEYWDDLTDEVGMEAIVEESHKFDNFVEENWNKWCFKDICDANNKCQEERKLEFILEFHINGKMGMYRKFIGENGMISEESEFSYLVKKEGKYVFSDYQEAINSITQIEECLMGICNEQGIKWQSNGIYFTIHLLRVKPPSHLFTEDEIREVLRNGNDFVNNRLAIDFDGYAQLIEGDSYTERFKYPVIQEGYDAGNNYVGEYANLDDVNEIYVAMLDAWMHHLKTGQKYKVDYYDLTRDSEQLIKEIKKYY